MPGVSIVIVAAGSGSRMGRGDKMFLDMLVCRCSGNLAAV
ncbi:MAG: hypothetical protein Ct9H300mP32_3380 [Verrucomicrobiota bacterium]|nr:MAG: hypothetical protein Ct9H300mP32_3380 [Verrucomicrobiota bacterium]